MMASMSRVRAAAGSATGAPRRAVSQQLQRVLARTDVLDDVPPAGPHKPKGVWMKWSNGMESFFHARWLWHHSPEFLHSGTGQRLMPPWSMPLRPGIKSAETAAEHGQQCLHIKWEGGGESTFSVPWLRANDYSEASLEHRSARAAGTAQPGSPGPLDGAKLESSEPGEYPEEQAPTVDWDAVRMLFQVPPSAGSPAGSDGASDGSDSSTQAGPSRVPFARLTDSKQGLLEALSLMNAEGAIVIEDVPCERGTVAEVAELVAPVMGTIYGDVFDVQAQKDPVNLAYSQLGLELHQDLAYYESPPGIQLLHCVEFGDAIQGGESTLMDVMAVAEQFREICPAAFDILASVPATLHKVHYARDTPVHMVYQRPHVTTATVDKLHRPLPAGSREGAITTVSWAPVFEGPLCVHPSAVEAYYEAYSAFARVIKGRERYANSGAPNSGAFIKFKLKPGDLVMFNNRRMLHGREAFGIKGASEGDGEATARHLQGCYINIDEYKSSLAFMTAAAQLEAAGVSPSSPQAHLHAAAQNVVVKRVGNQCMA